MLEDFIKLGIEQGRPVNFCKFAPLDVQLAINFHGPRIAAEVSEYTLRWCRVALVQAMDEGRNRN